MLLVTGATGHSGRYFLKELISAQYEGRIRLVVRDSVRICSEDLRGLDVELVVGDLAHKTVVRSAMQDVTTILHIANIKFSPNILELAIANGIRRVVLVHTTGIYSNHKSAADNYIAIENEVMLKANGHVNLTILRPTMIYGDPCDRNMSKFISYLRKVPIFPLFGGGMSLIQPIHAQDLGKAYYQVLMNPCSTANKHYTLSGEKPIYMKDALLTISRLLGRETLYVPIPISVGVLFATLIKIVTIGRVDVVEKVLRFGEDRAYDHQAASDDFGFAPMPFDVGIASEVRKFTGS